MSGIRLPRWSCLVATTMLLIASAATPAIAQDGNAELPQLNLLDQLSPLGVTLGGSDGDIDLLGEYHVTEGTRDGRISITATVESGWHVYSITQLPGGPQQSQIDVTPSDQFQVVGPFMPDHEPKIKRYEFFDVPVEEHDGTVVWSAPIRLAESADPTKLEIAATFNGQICQDDGVCIPIASRQVPVFFGGFTEPAAAIGEYRVDDQHVTFEGHVSAAEVVAGGTLTLSLTALPDTMYHVYQYAPFDPDKLSKPTLIVVTSPPDWQAGSPQASVKPHAEQTGVDAEPVMYYFAEPVTWSVELQVPADAQPGPHELAGAIGFQVCSDEVCFPPSAARFSTMVSVVPAETAVAETTEPPPLAFQPANYSDVATIALRAAGFPEPGAEPTPNAESLAGNEPSARGANSGASSSSFDLDSLDVDDGSSGQLPFALVMLVAFVGGFILNFMPCVLPVIGLKVMSFVQQAGESRSRILALNIWYSAGLISIFLVLATMAAVWNWGWGEQFNFDTFNIVMVSVVFTMGLSFLGVWEIPIPGFVGSGKASELAAKEGPAGAFAKGAVTTILATPCSGPGLATALAWCTGKPPWLVYLVFLVMGLGMASPYLVIGANPSLIRFIPKPGAWMDTFKQLMGFLLLGTVVYIFTFIQWVNVIPTLALLFGLWAACWWIGRTPMGATPQMKFRAWASATAFAVLIGAFAFSNRFGLGDFSTYGLKGIMEYRFASAVDTRVQDFLESSEGTGEQFVARADDPENDYELPWQPFTTEKLTNLVAENQTVLVDFTAKWCVTCKVLEQSVLNTRDVREVVDELGVVPLVADWSDRGPEIGRLMNSLGSKQVPVLAIFPAGRASNPIVLRGGYTKGTLIEKLREAGPSKGAAAKAPEVADESTATGNKQRVAQAPRP